MLSLLAATALLLSEWEVAEKTDPMEDTAFSQAHVIGEGGGIVVQCNSNGDVSLMFLTERFLGLRNGETYQVQHRFDSTPAEISLWRHAGNNMLALRGQRAKNFIAGMALAETLRLRLRRYDNTFHDATIPVAGAADAFGSMKGDCT